MCKLECQKVEIACFFLSLSLFEALIRETIKDRYVIHIAWLVDTSVADYT